MLCWVRSGEALPFAALSCRAKRSIPHVVIALSASVLHPSIHVLAQGIPHCVRNDRCFVGCDGEALSFAALSCRAQRSIPHGVIVLSSSVSHPSSHVLAQGIPCRLGMRHKLCWVRRRSTPLRRAVMQSAAKHPPWRDRAVFKCLAHLKPRANSGGFLAGSE